MKIFLFKKGEIKKFHPFFVSDAAQTNSADYYRNKTFGSLT